MVKDYFGTYDPSSPGTMGYNWRFVVWHGADSAVYGVHGNSGYLFRYSPRAGRVDVLDRITSQPSKLSAPHCPFCTGASDHHPAVAGAAALPLVPPAGSLRPPVAVECRRAS